MVLLGPDKGRRFAVPARPSILLGRASDDVPLTDYTVSRRHAEIRVSGDNWVLEDLKSANGTYVNDNRLASAVPLQHGDHIRIGSTLLIWDCNAERPADQMAEPTILSQGVDLEAEPFEANAAIINAVPALDDSIILASPAAAEAVRSWRVVSDLLEAVGATSSPRQLIERVLGIVFFQVPADRGFILMKDRRTGVFETEAVRHAEPVKERFRASRTIVDHVIKNREGILCSNVMSDARFSGEDRGDSLQNLGLQSVICVPMIAREDVLGVIYLDCATARHIYTEEQLRLIVSIARVAALAIEEARLVAERMRMERLAAAGETVAALSHHIKNILQGLKGGGDIVGLGLRKQDLSIVGQGRQVVDRNLEKVYSLAMNMLAFAKRREPKLDPVQLNTLVKDVLRSVQPRAADKGVAIESELSDTMPKLMLDENGIQQVIMNIVNNAVDAAPPKTGVGRIRASSDPTGKMVVLLVDDNGPGIPPEIGDKVFDAFYSTKGHGGTGLGLAVAKKIMDEHHGRIEVGPSPGGGAQVRVLLPTESTGAVNGADTLTMRPPNETTGA